MKKLILLFVFVLSSVAVSYAQNYDSAVGLRLGYPTSITYKKFISEKNAIEVFGGFRSRTFYSEIRVNAAYLIHTDIESVEGLRWYYGAGVGAAFYSYDFTTDDSGIGFTVSGYAGLEYTFADLPLTISVDWVPTYFIGGGSSGFGADGGALAVRYILGRDD